VVEIASAIRQDRRGINVRGSSSPVGSLCDRIGLSSPVRESALSQIVVDAVGQGCPYTRVSEGDTWKEGEVVRACPLCGSYCYDFAAGKVLAEATLEEKDLEKWNQEPEWNLLCLWKGIASGKVPVIVVQKEQKEGVSDGSR